MMKPNPKGAHEKRRRVDVTLTAQTRNGSLWHKAPLIEADGTVVTFRHDTGHTGITHTAFDPLDEARLAFGDSRGNVYAVYIRSNRYVLVNGCGFGVVGLVFSGVRRGDVVVALANKSIVVLNVENCGKVLQTLRGTHHRSIHSIATGDSRNGIVVSASDECIAVWSAPFSTAPHTPTLPKPSTTSSLLSKSSLRYDLRHTMRTPLSNPAIKIHVTHRYIATCHADALVFWEISGPVVAFKIPILTVLRPMQEKTGKHPSVLDDLPTYDCFTVVCAGSQQTVVAGSSRGATLAVFDVKAVASLEDGSSVHNTVTLMKTIDLSSVTSTPSDGFKQLTLYRRSQKVGGEMILAALSTSGTLHLVDPGLNGSAAKLLGSKQFKACSVEQFAVLRGDYLATVMSDTVSASHLKLLHLPSAEVFASFCSTSTRQSSTQLEATSVGALIEEISQPNTDTTAFIKSKDVNSVVSPEGESPARKLAYPVPLQSAVSGAQGWMQVELKPSSLKAKRSAAAAAVRPAGHHTDPTDSSRRLAKVMNLNDSKLTDNVFQEVGDGVFRPRATTTTTTTTTTHGEQHTLSQLYDAPTQPLRLRSTAPKKTTAMVDIADGKRVTMRQSVAGVRRVQRVVKKADIQEYTGLELTLNLSDQAVSLNVVKLRRMLFAYGNYPDQHRALIWRFLLRLPNSEVSNKAFTALLNKGPHPATRLIMNDFPVKDSKLRLSLEKVIDCLSYHCRALSVVDWLPEFVFPFAKLFGSNIKAAFECVLMFLTNWGKSFFVSYPHHSFETVSLVQELIALLDPELGDILLEKNCPVELYAWNPVVSVFTDILSASEWCQVMDHVVSNQPIWFYLFLVAYLSHHKKLFCSSVDGGSVISFPVKSDRSRSRLHTDTSKSSHQFFTAFFRRNNPIDVNTVIQKTYALHRKLTSLPTNAACEPLSYMECFPDTIGKATSTEPHPCSVYPVITNLMDSEIEKAVQERGRIVAEEAHLVRVKRNAEEMERQVEGAEKEHERRVREMVHKGEAAHMALEREAALHNELAQVKSLVLEQQAEARLRRIALQQRITATDLDLNSAQNAQNLGRLHTSLLNFQSAAAVTAEDTQREAMLLSIEESAQRQFEQTIQCMSGAAKEEPQELRPPTPLAEMCTPPEIVEEVEEVEEEVVQKHDAKLQRNADILEELRKRDASVGTSPLPLQRSVETQSANTTLESTALEHHRAIQTPTQPIFKQKPPKDSSTPALDALNRMVDRELLSNYKHTKARIQSMQREDRGRSTSTSSSSSSSVPKDVARSHEVLDGHLRASGALLKTELQRTEEDMRETKETLRGVETLSRRHVVDADIMRQVKEKDAELKRQLSRTEDAVEENVRIMRDLESRGSELARQSLLDAASLSRTASTPPHPSGIPDVSFAVSSLSGGSSQKKDAAALAAQAEEEFLKYKSLASAGTTTTVRQLDLEEEVVMRHERQVSPPRARGTILTSSTASAHETHDATATANSGTKSSSDPSLPFHNPFLNERSLDTVTFDSPEGNVLREEVGEAEVEVEMQVEVEEKTTTVRRRAVQEALRRHLDTDTSYSSTTVPVDSDSSLTSTLS